MSKVLAVDLDGTLFYPKGRRKIVSNKNVEFLRKFIDAGNKVVLISSRQPDLILKTIELVDRKMDWIAYSGALINIDNEIVKNATIENQQLKSLLDKLRDDYKAVGYFMNEKDNPVIVCPFIKLTKLVEKFYLWVYKLILGIYREKILVSRDEFYDKLDNGSIYLVRAFFGLSHKTKKRNKALNTQIRKTCPFVEASWMGIVLEFAPKGCNKGSALKEYVENVKCNHDDVYVIGDSGNDIPMFNEYHENSFVMKHAYPSVKKYASHRVSRVYKLEKYLFERSQNE